MRQAVRRVARGMFLVTVVLFDIITAFAALLLVLIWGGHNMSRTLKRPANGWDRRPNHLLPDLLWLVAWMFGGALFFNWMAATLDALLSL